MPNIEGEQTELEPENLLIEQLRRQLFGGWGGFPIIPGIDEFEIK